MLIAALTTAIYFLIGERYTHELGSTRFAAIAMSSSARGAGAALRAVPLVRASSARWKRTTGCCSASSRIACMFLPGLMQAEGVRRVGAQRAAIGSTVGPPTTIALAALFLGERLNGWQLAGQRHDHRQRADAVLSKDPMRERSDQPAPSSPASWHWHVAPCAAAPRSRRARRIA